MLDGLDCSFIDTPDSEGHSCKKGLSSLDLSHHVVFLFFFLKNFFNGFTCICAHDALIAAGEPPLRGEFLHIPGLCFFMTTVPDFWCVNSTFNQHKDMCPLCFNQYMFYRYFTTINHELQFYKEDSTSIA